MKENDTKKKSKDTKKKSFYVALYSCIGVMAVIAVILAYANISNNTIQQEQARKPIGSEYALDEKPQTAEVDMSNVGINLYSETGEIGSAISDDSELAKKPKASETPAPSEKVQPDMNESQNQSKTQDKAKPENSVPSAAPGDKNETTIIVPEEQETTAENEDGLEIVIEGNEEVSKEENIYENRDFTAFTEDQFMRWPVVGEVVMDFSMDKLVYDKTLEQYRTNDTLCIAASAGTQVVSSAPGLVKEVSKDAQRGNYVVIDHGNGWLTTYSQLQDNVLVRVNDVVDAGQIIGGIGNPSIYGVMLGNHLGFLVTKDTAAINPTPFLK